LVQVSMNPFKKQDPKFKTIHLGDIAKDVLSTFEVKLKNVKIDVSEIKRIAEQDLTKAAKGTRNKAPKNISNEFGFRLQDLESLYGDVVNGLDKIDKKRLEKIMSKPYILLLQDEKYVLKNMWLTAWDIIKKNSGGHKNITNISGLNYLNGIRVEAPDKKPLRKNQVATEGLGTITLKEIARSLYFKLVEVQKNL
jgi:hypothetical protein